MIALDDLTRSEREAVIAIDQLDVTGFCAIINRPDVASARRVIEGAEARIGVEIPQFHEHLDKRQAWLARTAAVEALTERARTVLADLQAGRFGALDDALSWWPVDEARALLEAFEGWLERVVADARTKNDIPPAALQSGALIVLCPGSSRGIRLSRIRATLATARRSLAHRDEAPTSGWGEVRAKYAKQE